jgi:predicted aconitase/predicted aconitase with swiveling domain
MQQHTIKGESLVPGIAAGPVLYADTGLSFMGGVNAATGAVIDVHHPLRGQSVAGKILAIPSGRGSCSGSLVLFELLMNGHAPRALVLQHQETILTLGVLIATELFARGIPVVCLPAEGFAALADAQHARVSDGSVTISDRSLDGTESRASLPELDVSGFTLSATDRRFLAGEFGEAAKIAMRIVIRVAQLEGADRLIDVDMAHIDGCFYQGPAGLQFIRKLRDLGGRVRVPTTMNAICVDRRQWRALGVPEGLGLPSDDLADAYVEMGVKPTYTCAPYLLEGSRPGFGQQIAWAESNAVVFANSVLGARTMKYPDYLDILCAITGRAPNADCHVGERRRATLRIDIPRPRHPDDSFYPLLGYHIGKIATNEIPLLCGLEGLPVSDDDLRAFGAAFATTSAAPMFHILGITPEAKTQEQAVGPTGPARRLTVTVDDLRATWRELNNAPDAAVDLISLGNPHFSLDECAQLATLCAGRRISDGVEMIITCGRDVYEKAKAAGHVARITDFGARFLNDTCWCFIGEPVVAREVRHILTNSGKYAHYGPAATDRAFHFGSLKRCVDAACSGDVETALPGWLAG